MIRLVTVTLVAIGLVLVIGGRDFTEEELAYFEAREAEERAARMGGSEPEVARARYETGVLAASAAAASAPVQIERDVAPEVDGSMQDAAAMAAGMDAADAGEAGAEAGGEVQLAAVQADVEAESVPETVEEEPRDLRVVTASAVNVRSGPSTDYAVLGRVVEGDITEVVASPNPGWVKIRIEGEGVEGYMAARFLEEVAE